MIRSIGSSALMRLGWYATGLCMSVIFMSCITHRPLAATAESIVVPAGFFVSFELLRGLDVSPNLLHGWAVAIPVLTASCFFQMLVWPPAAGGSWGFVMVGIVGGTIWGAALPSLVRKHRSRSGRA